MINDATMMHGVHWAGQDLAGWWISEKLHGCRATWDGSAMWSRGGIEIRIPDTWRARLPALPLDGELWAGREGFEIARCATQYGRFNSSVRFMVFDSDVAGSFLERQRLLQAALAGIDFASAVEHREISSTAAALEQLHAVRAARGEGLMARHPANVYKAGRSSEILKLKSFSATLDSGAGKERGTGRCNARAPDHNAAP